jgi:hypothetical protein
MKSKLINTTLLINKEFYPQQENIFNLLLLLLQFVNFGESLIYELLKIM